MREDEADIKCLAGCFIVCARLKGDDSPVKTGNQHSSERSYESQVSVHSAPFLDVCHGGGGEDNRSGCVGGIPIHPNGNILLSSACV